MPIRLSAILLSLLVASAANAQTTQVVRGRVTGDSAKPIRGAVVSVTMAPDRVLMQDTTNDDGRWSVRFERASGDYLVHIAAPGHQAFRKRVTVPASDTVVVVDASPVAVVQQLATVRVQATRPKPPREGDGLLPDGISNQYNTFGVNGLVAPELQGDLTAMAAAIPGLSVTANGISAFGLDPSQNDVKLNGLSFPGGSLPRNANMTTKFTTSAYDPASGGFAGVETGVTLSKGYASTSRRANVTIDAPFLQSTDRVSTQLGSRVTGGQASIGTSGEWVEDKWYYNLSADLSRRVSDAPSVLTGEPSLFPLSGLAPDSVARFLQTLSSIGVPAIAGRSALQRVTNDATFLGRIDHAPFKAQSFEDAPSTWGVVAMAKLQQRDALNASLTSTPARSGKSALGFGALQFLYSTYVQDYKLSETKTGVTVNHTRGTPYLRLPDASVLVSSQLPDGSQGTSSLAFGGNSRNDTDDLSWAWETISNYQWYVRGTHKVKVSAQSKLDAYRQQLSGNSLGAFSFASLADLAANRASSFSRTLSEPDRTGSSWNGAASVGDAWRASPNLQVMYGVRLEGNRYIERPALNSLLASTLGVRNDAAPSHLHASPRLGFSWRYAGGSGYNGFSMSNLGTRVMQPSGMLRGGIGEFRATMSPQLLGTPGVLTGLAGAQQRISCIGAAVPTPTWQTYASDPTAIPASCVVVGGAAPALSDAAPAVQVIDPSFDAPRSWRANLGWVSVVHSFSVSVDGSLSLNLNQGSTVDVNFAGAPRFTLAEEGRPVFASASSIVPSTGALSSVDARRSSAFASVLSRRSDLHSFSKQLTVTVQPPNIVSYWVNASYTLASASGESRGYDGGAFGDPRQVEQARTDFDTRHRLQLQLGKSFPQNFSLTMFINAASGQPYTPLVNGDVNGDGRSFDRAFIANPATTADPALAAGMRNLLAVAPSRARECLLEQLGKGAARNSCEGPWNASATARIGLATSRGTFGRRLNAALSITNPLAGLDQAFHGSSDTHGWGMSIPPDPVLLTVRGFDPANNRFRYEVNPRFGTSSPAQTTVRLPFRVTVDFSLDLGPSSGRQQLERVLNRGRNGHAGQRLEADSIRTRFARNVPNVYTQVIRISDSLLLSREQLEQLRAGEIRFAARSDSIWLPLGRELAALGDTYNAAEATQKTEDATDAGWIMARDECAKILAILSPLQAKLAPGIVQYLPKTTGRIEIRMYSY